MPEVATEGLWESILKDVHTQTRTPDKRLLVLGRPGIGKRTLIHSLLVHAAPNVSPDCQAEMHPEGHSRIVGMDYFYFGSRNPAEEEAASAPDWVNPAHTLCLILEELKFEEILTTRLEVADLEHLAAVICLDLKAPWTMMEDLRGWLEMLQRLTGSLLQQLPLAEQDTLREKVVKAVSGYKEPGDPEAGGGDASTEGAGASVGLTCNMAIPVVVVVTRSDGASALEGSRTAGWSEAIEAYLRNECLAYGASIVYTMVQNKNNRNVDVVYNYLMHRLYGFPLKHPANVPSRDALFIPSGWDSQAKIDQVAANIPGGGGLERSFESVIVCTDPPVPPTPPLEECEDVQDFLKRSAVVLQKLGGNSAANARRTQAAPADAPAAGDAARPKDAAGQPALDRKNSAKEGTDHAQLFNYFQSLLTEPAPGATAPKADDAAQAAAPAAPAVPPVEVTVTPPPAAPAEPPVTRAETSATLPSA